MTVSGNTWFGRFRANSLNGTSWSRSETLSNKGFRGFGGVIWVNVVDFIC